MASYDQDSRRSGQLPPRQLEYQGGRTTLRNQGRENLSQEYRVSHQTREGFQQQLDRIEKGVEDLKQGLLVEPSAQVHGTAGDQVTLVGRVQSFFSGSSSRNPEKMKAQDIIKAKDEEIKQLMGKLKAQEETIKELRNDLERQKYLTEQERQEAKKAKQETMAMVLKLRSWEEGHHSPGKKTKSSIVVDFSALFQNYTRNAVEYLKKKTKTDVGDSEYKRRLNQIFEVAYKECKSILFSSMFEELFEPNDSANPERAQLERAKQQARIYGCLYEMMDHTTPEPDHIIDVIKMNFPDLAPLLSENNQLKMFVQMAITTAWSMITMQPPMIAMCPPATVAKLNPTIHEKKEYGWDKCAKGDVPLVYLRPILYTSYAASQPEERALVFHETLKRKDHKTTDSVSRRKTHQASQIDNAMLSNSNPSAMDYSEDDSL